MEQTRTTAIVTGANRGIGLEVCRQLAGRGLRVVLTARNAEAGRAAAAALAAKRGGEAGMVEFHPLDVTDGASIEALAGHVRRRWGGLDMLVNNAAVSLEGFNPEVVRRTLATNFFGPLRLTDALLPLLRDHGRIVMVSSGMGELSAFPRELRAVFLDPALGRESLLELVERFGRAVETDTLRADGWPRSAYRVAKAALNAHTRLLAAELRRTRPTLAVNAVCPGWVRTDMGGRWAARGVAKGAEGIVWAATLPAGGPSGGFFRDGRPIPW
ncbi:MAG: SDR family NAD(P)-dependent oxidoreductase [Candidatus Lambdaproteobacteria bacterium]|nr:SDR family NAD(P)-dependent oxidoreductase [Candidatus Lambdaproteobacteria bacterium]